MKHRCPAKKCRISTQVEENSLSVIQLRHLGLFPGDFTACCFVCLATRSWEADYGVHHETLLVRMQRLCWGRYRWTLPRGSVAPDSISASPHPLFPGTDVLQGAGGGVRRHCVDQVMSQPLHSGSDFIPPPSGDREGWGHYFDLPAVIPLSEGGPGEGGVKVDSLMCTRKTKRKKTENKRRRSQATKQEAKRISRRFLHLSKLDSWTN